MPHQVVDSGLDETSCFFADGDGEEVTHGHYYEELGLKPPFSFYSMSSSSDWGYYSTSSSSYFSSSSTAPSPSPTSSTSSRPTHSASPTSSHPSSSNAPTSSPSSSYYVSTGSSSATSSAASGGVLEVFEGGDFSFYPDRRKVSDHAPFVCTVVVCFWCVTEGVPGYCDTAMLTTPSWMVLFKGLFPLRDFWELANGATSIRGSIRPARILVIGSIPRHLSHSIPLRSVLGSV